MLMTFFQWEIFDWEIGRGGLKVVVHISSVFWPPSAHVAVAFLLFPCDMLRHALRASPFLVSVNPIPFPHTFLQHDRLPQKVKTDRFLHVLHPASSTRFQHESSNVRVGSAAH